MVKVKLLNAPMHQGEIGFAGFLLTPNHELRIGNQTIFPVAHRPSFAIWKAGFSTQVFLVVLLFGLASGCRGRDEQDGRARRLFRKFVADKGLANRFHNYEYTALFAIRAENDYKCVQLRYHRFKGNKSVLRMAGVAPQSELGMCALASMKSSSCPVELANVASTFVELPNLFLCNSRYQAHLLVTENSSPRPPELVSCETVERWTNLDCDFLPVNAGRWCARRFWEAFPPGDACGECQFVESPGENLARFHCRDLHSGDKHQLDFRLDDGTCIRHRVERASGGVDEYWVELRSDGSGIVDVIRSKSSARVGDTWKTVSESVTWYGNWKFNCGFDDRETLLSSYGFPEPMSPNALSNWNWLILMLCSVAVVLVTVVLLVISRLRLRSSR